MELRFLTDEQRRQVRDQALQQAEANLLQATIRLSQAEADHEAARKALHAAEALFGPGIEHDPDFPAARARAEVDAKVDS